MSYTCKSCEQQFVSETLLYRHILGQLYHGYEKSCPYCDSTFTVKSELKNHLQEEHSFLKCPCCDEAFYSRKFFEQHVEDEHLLVDWTEAYIHLDGMEDGETFGQLDNRLEPNESEFYDVCEDISDRLETFMQHNTKYKNCDVVVAGSTAKKTAIHVEPFKSDLDLVLYFGPYDLRTMDDFIADVDGILNKLIEHVKSDHMSWATNVRLNRRTPFSMQLTVELGDVIKVDVLPAVDVLHGRFTQKARRKVYRRMRRMSDLSRGYFNASLTELQIHIFSDLPDSLRSVIRIIKMWGKTIRRKQLFRVGSYFFELVVLYIWERDERPDDVDVPQYVREVVHELCFCQSLRIVWPEHYDFLEYTTDREGPIVLDPANPFRDLAPTMAAATTISQLAIDAINDTS